jgi:1,2-diacylglycerol-3-alpha-glucose alpha-1,2-galactosyltransferase
VRDIPEYDDTFKDDVIRCTDNDFATAIAKLRDDKKFYRAQQVKTKRVAERFDSKNAAGRFMKLYRDLLTTSPGRTTTSVKPEYRGIR